MNIPLEEERRAGVPEVMEGYLGQMSMLQERHEGPLAEVGGVDEAAALTSKHKVLILVQDVES